MKGSSGTLLGCRTSALGAACEQYTALTPHGWGVGVPLQSGAGGAAPFTPGRQSLSKSRRHRRRLEFGHFSSAAMGLR